MAENKCLPCREICDCMTFTSPDGTVLVDKQNCTISLDVNPEALTVIANPADGTETKVNVGVGISKTGVGSTLSPYVLTNSGVLSVNGQTGNVTVPVADGSETKLTAGTSITITGAGTNASPYVINSTATSSSADGSETKINVGSGLSKGGTGTTLDPYILANTGVLSVNGQTGVVTVPTYDGSETKLQAGTNVTLSGSGTVGSPYIINASPVASVCAETIRPYSGASCCKPLNQALNVNNGIYSANNIESCVLDITIDNAGASTINWQSGFSPLGNVSDNRAAAQLIYRKNMYAKFRGFVQWIGTPTPSFVKFADTIVSSLIQAKPGAQVAYAVSQYNREWLVWGYLSQEADTITEFIVRTDSSGNWYIRSLSEQDNGTYYVNLENIMYETN